MVKFSEVKKILSLRSMSLNGVRLVVVYKYRVFHDFRA